MVAPALLENCFPVRSTLLGKLGLEKGDWVEFISLPCYFPGDVVLFITAEGSHKIGKIKTQSPDLEIGLPLPEGEHVTIANPSAVVGLVAKTDSYIESD